MRVGVYCGEFAPEEGGGHSFVQAVLEGFFAAASGSRHRFVVFAEPGSHTALAQRCAAAGVELALLPARGRLGMGIAALRHYSPLAYLLRRWPDRLERAGRERGVELMWLVPGLAYDALEIPYIGTVWDLQHRVNPWFPEVGGDGYWEHRELVYARFARRAARLIARSKTVAAQLSTLYGVPPERISVLGQPVTIQDASAPPSPAVAHFAAEPFFFYPAQFWPHKNHVNLLHALAHVDPRFSLVLTGADKGNLAHVRAVAAELGVAQRVRFAGFVSASDLAWLYRHAVALVYPSFNGPDNLPPLEAFALGCPVALADMAGMDEFAGDAALRFDPCDPAQMAQAMSSLGEQALLRQDLAQKGRARAAPQTPAAYVRGALGMVDEFEAVRRCWK